VKLKMLIAILLIAGVSGGAIAAPDDQGVLAIRAHTVWTMTEDIVRDGVILIRHGKIQAVGKDLTIPDGAKVLDMQQSHVMPGLIDAHSHLGLVTDPWAEMDETVFAASADTQVLDAFDPQGEGIQQALHAGITCALIAPGNRNPIAGQTAVVKFVSGPEATRLLKQEAGLKFCVTNETIQQDYRYPRGPTSRPGMLTFIREHLDRARTYDNGVFDPQLSALKRLVDKEIPVFIMANTPDEVSAALDIIQDYELKGCVIGGRQADELAERMAEQQIPVAYAPVISVKRDRELKRPAQLAGAGVKMAFASHAPYTMAADLRTSAVYAVKYGLDRDLALRGLTLFAAEMLGVDERVGSIQEGKDADLVIFGGDPLELTSPVQVVIVNGTIVFQREEK
jgi:imidazolonepropionase-like amidohydrolase